MPPRREAVALALADWLGLSRTALDFAYLTKKAGGYDEVEGPGGRALEIPTGSLYTAQARVVERILKCAPIAATAHGGVPGRSIRTHALVHLPQARQVLAMDVASAYESAGQGIIARVLRRALRPMSYEMGWDGETRRELADAIADLCCVRGRLPRGGPASAALYNLACAPLDKAIERLARERLGPQGRASRYLDDIVLSSPAELPRDLARSVAHFVRVHDLGEVNAAKTRWMRRELGEELIVTGVTHDGSGLALSRARLGELQAAVADALEHNNAARARGLLGFARSIYRPRGLPSALEALARRLPGGQS